ncbi:hypothetical protein BGX24_010802 [Mortierella sp. AD032]|nr:hypothetical protein BGX24_010802 [Mortierella sp. AD032]
METELIQRKAFTLPEIVFTIEKFILLWVPEVIRGEAVWRITPKDLVAAVIVNRIFHTLLTPILWKSFAYPCNRSHRSIMNRYKKSRQYPKFAPEAIKKNSYHFRYLDLLLYYRVIRDGDDIFDDDFITKLNNIIKDPFKFGQLQLSCTRLQELRITTSVAITYFGRLINATPGLRLLQYEQIFFQRNGLLSLLFPLCQLQPLFLSVNWEVDSDCLHHVLSNNAAYLEGLELGSDTQILRNWNGTSTNSASSWGPDTRAMGTDALKHPWTGLDNLYLALLGTSFREFWHAFNRSKLEATIITPYWTTTIWFSNSCSDDNRRADSGPTSHGPSRTRKRKRCTVQEPALDTDSMADKRLHRVVHDMEYSLI